MSLPTSPPRSSAVSLKSGDVGWGVYALQSYLNFVVPSAKLVEDGSFGSITSGAVIAFQKSNALTADGVAGPNTQRILILNAAARVELQVPGLPHGLLRGVLETESGFKLDEVNWSVSGGVDCGATQRRVYGPPFSVAAMKNAFGWQSLRQAASELLYRRNAFLTGAWVAGDKERAGRLACFAHNWPSAGGADYYADHGHVYNPYGLCSWLPRNKLGQLYITFPDGTLVRTRQDWAEFLAMGGVHGEGKYARWVVSWS